MIATIIIVGLAFVWLGYETKWLTIRLPRGRIAASPKVNITRLWFKTFGFYHPYRNTGFFPHPYESKSIPKVGYAIVNQYQKIARFCERYYVELSCGITDTLCGKKWLDQHWADLENYQPKVELYFGNGYKQTFTLKKPELIGKIIHINTGKKYFKSLMVEV